MYSNISQSRLVIAHKHLFFSNNSLKLAWRTKSSETCIYFDLTAKYGCDANNIDSEVIIINKTQDNSVVLQRGDLLSGRNNSAYFNISSYNEEGDLCEDLFLEQFKIDAESELAVVYYG